MTHEERNTLTNIFSNLMINAYMARLIYSSYLESKFAGTDGMMHWARTVIWVIPISIVVSIVMLILMNVIYAIITQNSKPSFIVDERDKVIGRKAMITVIGVSSTAFIMSVVTLAVGWSTLAAFNILFFGFAFADLASNLTKIFFYRRGY